MSMKIDIINQNTNETLFCTGNLKEFSLAQLCVLEQQVRWEINERVIKEVKTR